MRRQLRVLLIAATVATVAVAAGAETVQIRSGEHAGFSRIVLPLAAPTDWQFGRTVDGYQLRLGRADVVFDLSRVFDKIPHSRLADISAGDGDGRLSLQLGCACHAEAFAFRPDTLVIDIRSGPPPKNAPFEKMLEVGEARPHPRSRPAASPPAYDWRRVAAPALPVVPPPALEAAMPNPAVAKARAELLRQLARAGAQGLVTADPRRLGLAGGAAAAPAARGLSCASGTRGADARGSGPGIGRRQPARPARRPDRDRPRCPADAPGGPCGCRRHLSAGCGFRHCELGRQPSGLGPDRGSPHCAFG